MHQFLFVRTPIQLGSYLKKIGETDEISLLGETLTKIQTYVLNLCYNKWSGIHGLEIY